MWSVKPQEQSPSGQSAAQEKMLKKEKSQKQRLRGGWKNNHQQRIARESSHNVKGRTGGPGIREDRSRDNFWKGEGNSHIHA